MFALDSAQCVHNFERRHIRASIKSRTSSFFLIPLENRTVRLSYFLAVSHETAKYGSKYGY